MNSQLDAPGFCWPIPDDALPPLRRISQEFPHEALADVTGATRRALERLKLAERLPPGTPVLVGVGSRGISGIVTVVRTACGYLREKGFEPKVIGAMGSHGGGTEEGQESILRALWITAEHVGAEVITSSASEVIGTDKAGRPVYCDPLVFEHDGLLLVNRIKPHTTIRGRIQSGIAKMMVVGMGHQPGAEALHRSPPPQQSETVVQTARTMMEKIPFAGGLGLVEDAHESLALVEPLKPEDLFEREAELLERAEELMPRLPFEKADVLVIKWMGKEISGTGMDTNVINRLRVEGMADAGHPEIERIAVLGLTPASHGNACGIGLADFTTRRLMERIDLHATYLNVLTSRLTVRAMIPMIMDTDRDAVSAAIMASGVKDPDEVRLAVIRSTLHLEDMWVSPRLEKDMPAVKRVRPQETTVRRYFDEKGGLRLYD